MKFSRVLVLAMMVVVAVMSVSCVECGHQADPAAREVESMSVFRDSRTDPALCFYHSSAYGSRRSMFDNVDCAEAVRVFGAQKLDDEAARAARRKIRYVQAWIAARQRLVCFAHLEDSAGNMMSNLTSVPCESILVVDRDRLERRDIYLKAPQ